MPDKIFTKWSRLEPLGDEVRAPRFYDGSPATPSVIKIVKELYDKGVVDDGDGRKLAKMRDYFRYLREEAGRTDGELKALGIDLDILFDKQDGRIQKRRPNGPAS